ncbi:short-chain dehydrogenase reductase sdr [Moniliophthora roreri MCA 2997]|uniref:Short-chain dehydrogenase reductase sdr n=2 Tax=Moniliophthora roreri TaxID=221103 RepID=V2XBU0_MONRO|nr:short-chain dehydrogenase reductase sdr [Moniliophthora roreri MCA 2997]
MASHQNIWLITGTTSGFGRRLVTCLLRRGELVIATARSLDKLGELLKDFDNHSNLRTLCLDVTSDISTIRRSIDEALSFWGRIDVLVNNAGVGFKSVIEEASAEEFKKQFQTNFFGVIDVTNAVLSSMRTSKSGTIVNIGSRSSWKSEIPATGLYASSKAALRVYSETLATEVSQFNIRVMIVEPGAFRTEGILSMPYHTEHPISDYDATREKAVATFRATVGTQRGDPDKAMELLVNVVRGEGKAGGRPWPLYLPLGEDAEQAITEKCKKMLDAVDAWKNETSNLDFE